MGAHVIGHGDHLVGIERRRGAVGGEIAEDSAGAELPAGNPLQIHAGDAAGRDHGPGRTKGFEQHFFIADPVQPLDDEFAVSEQNPAVVWVDALGAGHEAQSGPDAAQVLGQGLHLEPTDLVREVELAVQVGGLDPVEVDQGQPVDAAAHQVEGHVRTDAAHAGDADVHAMASQSLYTGW